MVDSALASTYSSVNAFWRKGLVGPAPAVAVDAATPQADSAADTATNATDTVDDVAASTSASGEGDDAATDGVDGAGDDLAHPGWVEAPIGQKGDYCVAEAGGFKGPIDFVA